jgi:hypothetical protein
MPRAANLGKLSAGDYIFFQETLKNRNKPGDKRRYIFGYLKLKEITTIRRVFKQNLTRRDPYFRNDHIKAGEISDCTLFVGDPDGSEKLDAPLWINRDLVKELDLRDGFGNPIYNEFGKKRRVSRPMTDIEVINVYTRVVKTFSEEQAKLLRLKISR